MSDHIDRVDEIFVIGTLWLPPVKYATVEVLTPHELEDIKNNFGPVTRDTIKKWLESQATDFSTIIDFNANLSSLGLIIPWLNGEESECMWEEIMCFDTHNLIKEEETL